MRFSLLLAALAFVVAGCSTGATNTDASLDGSIALETSALSPSNTIVENAAGQPELEMLVAAVQRLDLAGTLSGDGPFTVFAPIDPAFDGMDLSAISDDQLRDVVTYHVVAGDVSAADLSDGMTLETLNGATLTVSTGATLDPDLKVDDADIVYTDIASSNGTIHLINLVLDPTRGGMAR